MIAAFAKIDASRDAQLKQINERKKEALAQLEKKFATNKQMKGPLTFIVIAVVCFLAFIVIFLDSFRLYKYLRAIFCRKRSQNKVNPIMNKNNFDSIVSAEDENSTSRTNDEEYKDLEYNLYVSFLVAKHNGTLRSKPIQQKRQNKLIK
jgi:hypothetical protein